MKIILALVVTVLYTSVTYAYKIKDTKYVSIVYQNKHQLDTFLNTVDVDRVYKITTDLFKNTYSKRITVVLHNNHHELSNTYFALTGVKNAPVAFYHNSRVFVNIQTVTAGILAHEFAHDITKTFGYPNSHRESICVLVDSIVSRLY